MQFSNRDFVTNAVLWLTDSEGLISLREKSVALRHQRVHHIDDRLGAHALCGRRAAGQVARLRRQQ